MIRIESRSATVELAPDVGGAIASFRVGAIDVLRATPIEERMDGNVRAFACYPLVPYSNRIAQARLRVGDDVHALARNFGDHPHAIHGVGWQRSWRVLEQRVDAATIGFDHDPRRDGPIGWPFAFRAWQAIALHSGPRTVILTMTIGIESLDARPFPFGLGFHPFFPRRADTRASFRASGVWQTDATRIPTALAEPPAGWRFDPPRTIDDAEIDNVFTGWNGHARLVWPDLDAQVSIDADRALSHLVVFVPRARPYLAIEPVSHMTDAFNRAASGATGTGTRTLHEGQSFSCTMRLTVAPAGWKDR